MVGQKKSHTHNIPLLSLTWPSFCLPFSQTLALSTIEGLIERATAGLEQEQPIRKVLETLEKMQINSY